MAREHIKLCSHAEHQCLPQHGAESVCVRIDQAGQQSVTRRVDDFRSGRHIDVFPDSLYQPVLNNDNRVL